MNKIVNPTNLNEYSIYSYNGKKLLKKYIKNFNLKAGNDLQKSISVLQFNIWSDITDNIVNVILQFQPDVITVSETRYNEPKYDKHRADPKEFQKRIYADSKKTLCYYYTRTSDTSIFIKKADNIKILNKLNKYEIKPKFIFKYNYLKDNGSIIKVNIIKDDVKYCIYNSHLDFHFWGYYFPRYKDNQKHLISYYKYNKRYKNPYVKCEDDNFICLDTSNIKKNQISVNKINKNSYREYQIKLLIKDSLEETKKGFNIILGSDLNEPSILDKMNQINLNYNLKENNCKPFNYKVTSLLKKNKFIDLYRVKYENPVINPGITYPVMRAWSGEYDNRDRLDFIHLKLNNNKLDKLKTVIKIIGPKYEIAYNKNKKNTKNYLKFRGNKINSKHTDDLVEVKKWSSDHKAVFANIFLKR